MGVSPSIKEKGRVHTSRKEKESAVIIRTLLNVSLSLRNVVPKLSISSLAAATPKDHSRSISWFTLSVDIWALMFILERRDSHRGHIAPITASEQPRVVRSDRTLSLLRKYFNAPLKKINTARAHFWRAWGGWKNIEYWGHVIHRIHYAV